MRPPSSARSRTEDPPGAQRCTPVSPSTAEACAQPCARSPCNAHGIDCFLAIVLIVLAYFPLLAEF